MKETSRERIAAFFSHFGQVVDVAMAYNDYKLVEKYEERGSLKLEAETARRKNKIKKQNKILQQVEKVDHDILHLQKKLDLKLLTAYVTFEHQHEMIKCLKAFPDGFLLRCCMPKYCIYQGHKLRVEHAPEPSNILYKNLHYSSSERTNRRRLTMFITFLLILASCLVTFYSQDYRQQLDDQQSLDCALSEYTLEMAINDANVTQCFCQSLGTDIFLQRTFCQDYLTDYLLAKSLLIAAASTVVIVNLILKILIHKLTNFEKHHTRSHEQLAAVQKLFISFFINTALLSLFINANLDFIDPKFNFGLVFNGEFEDVTPDWYNVVAISITITMILNMFSTTIFPFLSIFINKCQRKCCLKQHMTSQNDLNQFYGGKQFTLSYRYAYMLNTFFVVLFYSPGIPILFPIGMLTYFFQYWFDKAAFFRLYSIPPRYDSSLEAKFLNYLKISILIHCAMAIWFYTSPSTLSYSISPNQPDI